MAKILAVELLLLANLLAVRFTRELETEVRYEMVEGFGPYAEEMFKRSHNVVRRAANSSTPTPGPTFPSASTDKSNVTVTESSTLATEQNATSGPSATSRAPTTPGLSNTSQPTNTTQVNITKDYHLYYESLYEPSGEKWWFNLEDGGVPKLHEELSQNSQFSDTLNISFTFPYYGHVIDNVTITNKGYVFLGETVHKFNASTQYVAPLMADFGPHLHENTTIRYIDTGNRFTVEWSNMRLMNQTGEFSFQCSIFKNGTLVFAYKKIPFSVNDIKNDSFPLRVGLSDSYRIPYIVRRLVLIDGQLYILRILYIGYFVYHRVELDKSKIKNGSAFVITPLPNCVLFNSCDSCVNSKTAFSCKWCPTLNRCSDGFDRGRAKWRVFGCVEDSKSMCTAPTSESTRIPGSREGKRASEKPKPKKQNSGISTGEIFAIVLCICLILALIFWVLYAYRHPQSNSGMFLMQYGNPSRWFRNSKRENTSNGGRITFKTMSNESNA